MSEIKRLTARSPKNNMPYLVNVKSNEQEVEGSYNTLMCIRDSWERLAQYEETGLMPDEFKSLISDAGIGIAIRSQGLRAENATLKTALDKINNIAVDFQESGPHDASTAWMMINDIYRLSLQGEGSSNET